MKYGWYDVYTAATYEPRVSRLTASSFQWTQKTVFNFPFVTLDFDVSAEVSAVFPLRKVTVEVIRGGHVLHTEEQSLGDGSALVATLEFSVSLLAFPLLYTLDEVTIRVTTRAASIFGAPKDYSEEYVLDIGAHSG